MHSSRGYAGEVIVSFGYEARSGICRESKRKLIARPSRRLMGCVAVLESPMRKWIKQDTFAENLPEARGFSLFFM